MSLRLTDGITTTATNAVTPKAAINPVGAAIIAVTIAADAAKLDVTRCTWRATWSSGFLFPSGGFVNPGHAQQLLQRAFLMKSSSITTFQSSP